jgi:hypothetical protein
VKRSLALNLLVGALCLWPISAAFLFIRAYGVNVAVVDDFFFVDGFSEYFSGGLSLAYFANLHNHHCLFFGKIFMLLLGLATHFNIIAEMFVSWGFILLTFLLVAYLVLKNKPNMFVALLIPLAFVFFSLRPWDVFLNGSVFLNSITIFSVVASVVLLSKAAASESLNRSFVCACVTAVIGSFTGSASGLLVWPVGLVQIARRNFKDFGQRPQFKTWGALFMLCSVIYGALAFITESSLRLSDPSDSSCLTSHAQSPTLALAHNNISASVLNHISSITTYLLTLLGFPICSQLSMMQTWGAIVFLLYVILAISYCLQIHAIKQTAEAEAAFSIFLFGACSIALVAYGRCDRGYLEATATRYVQFFDVMLIGAIISIGLSRFKSRFTMPLLLFPLIALTVATVSVGYYEAPVYGAYWRNLQLKNAYILRTYKIQADSELTALQSNPYFVKTQAAKMEKLKLNVFARSALALDKSEIVAGEPTFCLDRINGLAVRAVPKPGSLDSPVILNKQIFLDRHHEQSISLSGWAFDPSSMQAAKKVALAIDEDGIDRKFLPACNGLRYPGVAESFGAKKLGDCGIFASFSSALLKPGSCIIRLAVESSDGQRVTISKPIINAVVR